MGLKKFVRRAGKFVKKAAAAYATYQTGGLAGVAIAAASKLKSRRAAAMGMGMTMVQPMSSMSSSGMAMMMREASATPASVSLPEFTEASLPTTTRSAPVSMLRRLPALGTLRRVGGAVGRALPGVGTAIGIAQLGRDLVGGSRSARAMMGMRPKYRRMNPANAKAAMRAVRRIKATRKLLAKIERSLPKRKGSTQGAYCPPARRAPPRRRH